MPETTARQQQQPARHGTTYLWVAAIGALFTLLCVTGVAMMTVYSPSVTAAWASVAYMQDQCPGGWLVRGLHHFASDGLIIVCAAYVLHRVLTRRYSPPRTVQWWLSVLSVALAMAGALTGALLTWDQKAYWGTTVRVNIVSLVPVLGNWLRESILGGPQPAQLTLTRFFTLHVVILPALFYAGLRVRRRNASKLGKRTCANGKNASGESAIRKTRARMNRSLVRLAVVLACLAAAVFTHNILGYSNLHAPADPSILDYPARPEWFNLFLFQWLKNFKTADAEIFGAIIVPGALTTLLMTLPWWPRVLTKRLGHTSAVAFVLALYAGAAFLTVAAWRDDSPPSQQDLTGARQKQAQGLTLSPQESRVLQAHDFQIKVQRAAFEAERTIALARENGVPPEGPLSLTHSDPELQGPRLFAAHCASCHRYNGYDGLGITPADLPTSSDLGGFGTREWVRSLLVNPMSDEHFGLMTKPDGKPAHTRMKKWIAGQREDSVSDADRAALEADFDAVAAYLADEAIHPGQVANSEHPEPLLARGREYFMSTCNECHTYQGEQEGTRHAPEMFGYGSVEWIEDMIAEPDSEARYRSKGRQPAQMPAFSGKLSPTQINLLARWLSKGSEKTALVPPNKP